MDVVIDECFLQWPGTYGQKCQQRDVSSQTRPVEPEAGMLIMNDETTTRMTTTARPGINIVSISDQENNNNTGGVDDTDEDKPLMMCRICHSESPVHDLIIPCNCCGSLKYVHQSCLQNWLKINGPKPSTTLIFYLLPFPYPTLPYSILNIWFTVKSFLVTYKKGGFYKELFYYVQRNVFKWIL